MSEAKAGNQENAWEIVKDTYKSIHTDIKMLTVAITELRADMPKQPCETVKQHIKNHESEYVEVKEYIAELKQIIVDHKKEHIDDIAHKAEIEVIRKKFVYNIATIVIASGIISIVGAAIYAFRNGFGG